MYFTAGWLPGNLEMEFLQADGIGIINILSKS